MQAYEVSGTLRSTSVSPPDFASVRSRTNYVFFVLVRINKKRNLSNNDAKHRGIYPSLIKIDINSEEKKIKIKVDGGFHYVGLEVKDCKRMNSFLLTVPFQCKNTVVNCQWK